MAPHSSTLAWKVPWREEPGRLQSMGLLRVRHNWATSLSLFTFMHWRRKWQPTPVFLPGESQGQGSLVSCHLWGRTESDTTEVMQQQQQQMRPDAMIFVFWMLSFKPTFSLSSFTFIKGLLSSSSLSAIRMVSSAYLRLLMLAITHGIKFLFSLLCPFIVLNNLSVLVRSWGQLPAHNSLRVSSREKALKSLKDWLETG